VLFDVQDASARPLLTGTRLSREQKLAPCSPSAMLGQDRNM
jgi:hypothetical protein